MTTFRVNSGPRHGTYSTYVKGCRCRECRAAQHAYYELNLDRFLARSRRQWAAIKEARGY